MMLVLAVAGKNTKNAVVNSRSIFLHQFHTSKKLCFNVAYHIILSGSS